MAAILTLRFSPHTYLFNQTFVKFRRTNPRNLSFFAKSILQNGEAASTPDNLPSTSVVKNSPLSGMEDITVGYIFGMKKATEVAHSVWKNVVQKGDTLVDATCGNGYDTLAMVKMFADKSCTGRVYAMDIQKAALENTLSLLDESLNPDEVVVM
ncbi:hypothetical protein F0562_008578 [Nyssa sinensis]|uniref:Methyltransferase domain-containing protein n=1 Tax=Nyssa sinensis TaxID=561372 RepID=A0A5J5A8F8_9ASTE|nr:hypothetical protein F0562_008578 [Nyssa sinensis]